jgi:exopolyphosphatase/guanosine-5'-triphosphate,3'-diphosphate pyrophosphatase
MLLGVLDIGSTAAQLLVVDTDHDTPPLPTHTIKRQTLLGDAFTRDGSIDAAGVDRLVGAVADTVNAAREHGVRRLCVVVTAAVRDATNREKILARLERETGVRPSYLAGEDEAKLGYLAARHWHGGTPGRMLLLDIGGGSMEIAVGDGAEPDFVVSLPLGARQLTNAFLRTDPPKPHQLRDLREHVEAILAEVEETLPHQGRADTGRAHQGRADTGGADQGRVDQGRVDQGRADTVIATSRIFSQLARLTGAPSARRGPFARRTLTRADLQEWIPRLARRSSSERAQLRGVSQNRARQILAGAIVADAVLTKLGIDTVQVCPWALREGLILRHLDQREQVEVALATERAADLVRFRPA